MKPGNAGGGKLRWSKVGLQNALELTLEGQRLMKARWPLRGLIRGPGPAWHARDPLGLLLHNFAQLSKLLPAPRCSGKSSALQNSTRTGIRSLRNCSRFSRRLRSVLSCSGVGCSIWIPFNSRVQRPSIDARTQIQPYNALTVCLRPPPYPLRPNPRRLIRPFET